MKYFLIFSLFFFSCNTLKNNKHYRKQVFETNYCYTFTEMTPKNFIDTYAPIALPIAVKYHIPVNVMLAQAINESGWGSSAKMMKFNAMFGIKAYGWAGKTFNTATLEEYQPGVITNINDSFRAYDNVKDSFEDYAKLVTTDYVDGPKYATNTKGWKTDLDFITGVKKSGYATDSGYVNNIMSIIGIIAPMVEEKKKKLSEEMQHLSS